MSRVRKPGNKWMNTNKYSPSVTNPTPLKRSKGDHVDYTKAKTLTSWLFLKYDMSYKTYSHKSQSRREELRQEFMRDTGSDRFLSKEHDDESFEEDIGF